MTHKHFIAAVLLAASTIAGFQANASLTASTDAERPDLAQHADPKGPLPKG